MKTDEKQDALMDETLTTTPEKPSQEAPEEAAQTPENVTEETSEETETPELSAEDEIGALFTNTEEEPSGSEESEEPSDSEKPVSETSEESLSDDEFDELVSSKEKFTEYIKKSQEATIKSLTETFRSELNVAKQEMLAKIPDVVGNASKQAIEVKNETTKFFQDYPYLTERRAYVRDMVARISTEKPELSPRDILAEVGRRAERDFSAYEKAKERETTRNTPFAGAGGRRAPSGQTDNRSRQQKLLDETFS